MEKGELFRWLVNYHCAENLQRCLPFIRDGIIHDPHGQPYESGKDQENEYYSGLLVVANGPELASNLKKDKIILDKHLPAFHRTRDESEFWAYLKSRPGKDGAYVVNTHAEETGHVKYFNNTPLSLSSDFELDNLCSWDMVDEPGNKTMIAMIVAHAYPNTDSYLIRRSPDGNMGIGPVLHFGRDGLEDKIQLNTEPEHQGPFIDPERKITALHTRYQRNEAGVLVPKNTAYIDGRAFGY